MKKILSLLFISSLGFFACQEDFDHDPITSDDVKPGPIENLQYSPIKGGFDIS